MDNICDICDKIFKNPSALKTHKNRKVSCMKVTYPCDSCTKTFATDAGMKKHMIICNRDIDDEISIPIKKNTSTNKKTSSNTPFYNTINNNTSSVSNHTINNNINNSLNANVLLTSTTMRYYNNVQEANSSAPHYGIKYNNTSLNSCNEEDITFIKDLIAQNDMESATILLGNFLIDHCSYGEIRSEGYWMPEESLLVRFAKLLVASLTTWNKYAFESELKYIVVAPFIEFVNQFMYSYMVEYIYQVMDAAILNQQLNIILRVMNEKVTLINNIYEHVKDKILINKEIPNITYLAK